MEYVNKIYKIDKTIIGETPTTPSSEKFDVSEFYLDAKYKKSHNKVIKKIINKNDLFNEKFKNKTRINGRFFQDINSNYKVLFYDQFNKVIPNYNSENIYKNSIEKLNIVYYYLVSNNFNIIINLKDHDPLNVPHLNKKTNKLEMFKWITKDLRKKIKSIDKFDLIKAIKFYINGKSDNYIIDEIVFNEDELLNIFNYFLFNPLLPNEKYHSFYRRVSPLSKNNQFYIDKGEIKNMKYIDLFFELNIHFAKFFYHTYKKFKKSINSKFEKNKNKILNENVKFLSVKKINSKKNNAINISYKTGNFLFVQSIFNNENKPLMIADNICFEYIKIKDLYFLITINKKNIKCIHIKEKEKNTNLDNNEVNKICKKLEEKINQILIDNKELTVIDIAIDSRYKNLLFYFCELNSDEYIDKMVNNFDFNYRPNKSYSPNESWKDDDNFLIIKEGKYDSDKQKQGYFEIKKINTFTNLLKEGDLIFEIEYGNYNNDKRFGLWTKIRFYNLDAKSYVTDKNLKINQEIYDEEGNTEKLDNNKIKYLLNIDQIIKFNIILSINNGTYKNNFILNKNNIEYLELNLDNYHIDKYKNKSNIIHYAMYGYENNKKNSQLKENEQIKKIKKKYKKIKFTTEIRSKLINYEIESNNENLNLKFKNSIDDKINDHLTIDLKKGDNNFLNFVNTYYINRINFLNNNKITKLKNNHFFITNDKIKYPIIFKSDLNRLYKFPNITDFALDAESIINNINYGLFYKSPIFIDNSNSYYEISRNNNSIIFVCSILLKKNNNNLDDFLKSKIITEYNYNLEEENNNTEIINTNFNINERIWDGTDSNNLDKEIYFCSNDYNYKEIIEENMLIEKIIKFSIPKIINKEKDSRYENYIQNLCRINRNNIEKNKDKFCYKIYYLIINKFKFLKEYTILYLIDYKMFEPTYTDNSNDKNIFSILYAIKNNNLFILILFLLKYIIKIDVIIFNLKYLFKILLLDTLMNRNISNKVGIIKNYSLFRNDLKNWNNFIDELEPFRNDDDINNINCYIGIEEYIFQKFMKKFNSNIPKESYEIYNNINIVYDYIFVKSVENVILDNDFFNYKIIPVNYDDIIENFITYYMSKTEIEEYDLDENKSFKTFKIERESFKINNIFKYKNNDNTDENIFLRKYLYYKKKYLELKNAK